MKPYQEYYSNNPSADRINEVRGEIAAVKDVMVHNIEKVLERGEKMELLVDKTDNLNQQAFQFKKKSTQVIVCSFFLYSCLSAVEREISSSVPCGGKTQSSCSCSFALLPYVAYLTRDDVIRRCPFLGYHLLHRMDCMRHPRLPELSINFSLFLFFFFFNLFLCPSLPLPIPSDPTTLFVALDV